MDDSMSEDGYVAPMTAAADGEVIDGSARLERAFDKFDDEAIIISHDGTRPIIARRLDIPDANNPIAKRISLRANRIAEADLSWDAGLLAELAASDPKTVEGMFSDKELAEILSQTGSESKDAEPQIDKAEELRQKWGTETGQLWVIGNHRLYCADNTTVALQGVDTVVTDPPFGIDWDTDYTRFTTEYGTKRVNHKPIANDDKEFDPRPWLDFEKVVLWGANWYCKHIPLGSWLVWDKRHPNGTAWLSDAEIAWMKGKRGVYIYAETVQGAHRKEKSSHPTQKPVGLMAWCIERIGSTTIICDPFAGSGSTMVACENLGRKCWSIESEPAYCAVILERMTTAFPHLKIERSDRAEAA